MVTARPVIIRCPTCRKPLTNFTEVLFLDNFTVILNGICCEAEITSGELPYLSLLPLKEERSH